MSSGKLPKGGIPTLVQKMPLAKQRKAASAWLTELSGNGHRARTLNAYRYVLTMLARRYRKPFQELSKKDLSAFLSSYDKPSTRNSYGVVIKSFLSWLNGGQYPESIAWWTPRTIHSHLTEHDIFTQDEILAMIRSAEGVRQRAFIHALYESGMRIGEFLSLKRSDVRFDGRGAVLDLADGKTGHRTIRIVSSAVILRNYLNEYPGKEDALLWRSISQAKASAWVRNAAKPLNKKITPHLLRHSRATHLRRAGVSEQTMRCHFGWCEESTMVEKYSHLSKQDVDDEICTASGMELKKKDENNKLAPVVCPSCGHLNDIAFSYCAECSAPLTAKPKSLPELLDRWKELKAANNIGQEKVEVEDELSRVMTGIIENFDLVMQTFKPMTKS